MLDPATLLSAPGSWVLLGTVLIIFAECGRAASLGGGVLGTVIGMATRKVTYSLETDAITLAEQAAARAGVSTSAWLSRAARREAVRVGYTPRVPAERDAAEAQALADEAERAAAEEEMREAG